MGSLGGGEGREGGNLARGNVFLCYLEMGRGYFF